MGDRWPGLLAACVLVVLLGCLIGGPAAELAFVVATTLCPVALIAIGAREPAVHRARMRLVLAVLALILVGSAVAVWSLSPAGGGWLDGLGLPAATVVMLVGMGLAPLLLVGLGHAAAFRGRREAEREKDV